MVSWREWGSSAFEEARKRRVPVLLWAVTPFSSTTERIETTTFKDARVATFVEGNLVPIRVDALERPDVVSRYAGTGLPLVAFLTPSGHLLTSLSSPRAEALLSAIGKVCLYYRDHADDVEKAALERERLGLAAKEGSNPITSGVLRRVEQAIRDSVDPKTGELAGEAKRVFADPVVFLCLRHSRTGDEELAELAFKVLDRWATGPLFDKLDGGFFYKAVKDDYSDMEYSKPASDNAEALRAYACCYRKRPSQTLENVLRMTSKWACEALFDERTGGFYTGLLPEPEYYAQGRRPGVARPKPLKLVYTSATAALARALLDTALLLQDRELGRKALSSAELLWRECFDPAEGMAHRLEAFLSERRFGLFADQLQALDLTLRVYEIGGHPLHLRRAISLAGLMETLYGDPEGGFYDRTPSDEDVGQMKFRKKSVVENGHAATLFYKLGALTRNEHFKEVAAAALWRFTAHLEDLGALAAAAGVACDVHLNGMVEVVVVGGRGDPDASRLRVGALELFLPCVAVSSVDPADESLMRIRRLDYHGSAVAFIFHGGERLGPLGDTEELAKAVSDVVRGGR